MIVEMNVPSPGESISEVEIATWLVADGDYVEQDQEICEIDSDKATLTFFLVISEIRYVGICEESANGSSKYFGISGINF